MNDEPKSEPPVDCGLCPRLVDFRHQSVNAHPEWFNGAVPSFGDAATAKLLVIGLAPGLQGANKTGRPFTGDYAGDLLYATLLEFGFARGVYDSRPDDGLELVDAMITNAVRCVPPANKPVAAEINNCRPFLVERIRSLSQLQVIVALGRIAHDTTLATLGLRKAAYKFGHGARHDIGDDHIMIDSYHCSRYNTNTGRLTTEMFHDVFRLVRKEIEQP